MNIGAKIRELRKEKKMTQEELAEYLHVSSQAVSKWETGASCPDIDTLPKLAICFGASLDNLLDFDQSKLDAAIEAILLESGRGGNDPARSEAILRKALEKYPNNDLLLTCILEDMEQQNHDGTRNMEIIETGERILSCTKDESNRIDVYRAMAETYHKMGEQAMAEQYLEKIPAVHFMYYEIAAAIKRGSDRIKNIECAEDLCIDKLICMLWMRRLEAKTAQETVAIDEQARALFDCFKRFPTYQKCTEIMEDYWDHGKIMEIY